MRAGALLRLLARARLINPLHGAKEPAHGGAGCRASARIARDRPSDSAQCRAARGAFNDLSFRLRRGGRLGGLWVCRIEARLVLCPGVNSYLSLSCC